jgi:hypothetical protein
MTFETGFEIWERLKQITSLNFTARSANSGTGWNGTGKGYVNVELVSGEVMLFSESGTWATNSGTELAFSNRYRWSLSTRREILKLEHLRYGDDRPVKLLELYCNTDLRWKTSTPHICNKDRYTLEINCSSPWISMDWQVIGPAKNEQICYRYN